MALKLKLTTAEFTALSDTLKTEYKLQTDGTYTLDLGDKVFTTDKDPAALMAALEHERAETAKVKAIADALEKKLPTLPRPVSQMLPSYERISRTN